MITYSSFRHSIPTSCFFPSSLHWSWRNLGSRIDAREVFNCEGGLGGTSRSGDEINIIIIIITITIIIIIIVVQQQHGSLVNARQINFSQWQINHVGKAGGKTALQSACHGGNQPIVKHLLDMGAKTDIFVSVT